MGLIGLRGRTGPTTFSLRLGTRWIVFLLVAVSCLGLAADVSAQSRCLVADPTGTPLNVRKTPNGAILGTLPNGLPVTVLDITSYRGQTWAHIGRIADHSPFGWVSHDFLDCGQNLTGQFRLLSSQAFRYSGEETFTVPIPNSARAIARRIIRASHSPSSAPRGNAGRCDLFRT